MKIFKNFINLNNIKINKFLNYHIYKNVCVFFFRVHFNGLRFLDKAYIGQQDRDLIFWLCDTFNLRKIPRMLGKTVEILP